APLPSLAPPPPLAPEAAPAPAPVPVPEPAVSLAPPATMTFAQPFSAPPVPTPEAAPAPAPAATPAPSFDDLAGSAPPVTMQVSGGASEAAAPVDAASPSADAVLARLAKPSAPPTAPPVPRPRSYKAFYVAGALLVVLLAGIGYMFRTPKAVSDLTTLDDGRPGVGAEDASAPVAAPPPMPEPAPAPPPAAPEAAAPQADTRTALDAAVELVKGFPLDGDRGTVGAWLQYSYAASADAGREVWSASAKGDDLFLVEYRVEPAPGSSSPGVFYLFEADMARRFILAKNPEARQMLAGAPPPVETKPAAPKKRSKPRAAPKPKPRPRPEPEEPKEVPLLPLPGEGELRPPAEDDGAFGADTVGGGI
ncbi:MAG: hypothetical protein SF051_04800, partial [Elusimicrobiota bacterium]|nr:hypothetical protein [Elusimicrobiota bacterium]